MNLDAPLLLSISLPNFNHGKYLIENLPVLIQELESAGIRDRSEIVIIDDASTDNSREIIADFCQKYPRLFRFSANPKNIGVIKTLSLICEMARGQYIFFFSADDLIKKNFFKISLDLLVKHPEAALCPSLADLLDEKGQNLGLFVMPVPCFKSRYLSPQTAAQKLERIPPWFIGTGTIYRRDLLKKHFFDFSTGPFCDGLLALELTLRYGACFIPQSLSYWRRLPYGYAASVRLDEAQCQAFIDKIEAKLRADKIFTDKIIKNWLNINRFINLDTQHFFLSSSVSKFNQRLRTYAVPSFFPIGKLIFVFWLGISCVFLRLARSVVYLRAFSSALFWGGLSALGLLLHRIFRGDPK